MSSQDLLAEPYEFSLVLGGPLYTLFRRAHLSGDTLELLRRRIMTLALVAWLPLLVFSVFGGQALSNNSSVGFLADVQVHVRLLIALPLFVVAELVVHQRLRFVLRQFLQRDLISEAALPRFEAAIASAMRLRNSVVAELLIILFVYTVGGTAWHRYSSLDSIATWVSVPEAASHLSLAGIWYGFISLPLFQFLLLRWYFRLCIWTRLLWQVSRLGLRLVPTHPDRCGGLGFLSETIYGFIPLTLAHGAVLSGVIFDAILYLGATLPQYAIEIVVVVVAAEFAVFGPLLAFAIPLTQARRTGLREYGTLAGRYAREFDTKWLRGGAAPDEQLLGSADIQSLADLGNSFAVVQSMRVVLISRDAMFRLTLATVAPVLPLVLTMVPLNVLMQKLLGIFF